MLEVVWCLDPRNTLDAIADQVLTEESMHACTALTLALENRLLTPEQRFVAIFCLGRHRSSRKLIPFAPVLLDIIEGLKFESESEKKFIQFILVKGINKHVELVFQDLLI